VDSLNLYPFAKNTLDASLKNAFCYLESEDEEMALEELENFIFMPLSWKKKTRLEIKRLNI